MPWQLVVFAIVMVGVTASSHIYLWRRLFKAPAWGRGWSTAGAVLIGALALTIPTAMALGRQVERTALGPLPLIAFTWMGLVFYLLLIHFAVDAISVARRTIRRRISQAGSIRFTARPAAPPGESSTGHLATHANAPMPTGAPNTAPEPEQENLSRRQFLHRATAVSAFGGSGVVGLIGARKAYGEFETPVVPVRLERLPPQLSGMKIALLSDVHIGSLLDRRFLTTAVERTNALRPDLVAITGDLVDAPFDKIGRDVAALQGLRSRYGTFFVTGNHEYYSGVETWIEALGRMGIRVLGNEHLAIGDSGPQGATFDLAGVHDRFATRSASPLKPDFDAAFAGRDPERECVLLAHQPKDVLIASAYGAGLQLSGHTHGGQLWPFGAATRLAQPYVAGLHRHAAPAEGPAPRDTQIYVTCGTGFWGPPMRIGAPAEITLIELVAG